MNEESFSVPQDNKELYLRYAPYVARLLRRYDNVGRHFDDLLQAVWLRLLEANVLGKYAESLGRLPATLTGADAARYLGVTFSQWRVAQWRTKVGIHSWAPAPISGDRVQKSAVFQRAAVDAVAGHFKRHAGIELEMACLGSTKGRFEAYLTVSVRNAFKNFCRTLSRKDKDLYLPPDERGNPWEARVESRGASPEICAELSMAVGGAGDLTGDVLSLLDDGYTMSEIVSKLSSAVQVRQARIVRQA